MIGYVIVGGSCLIIGALLEMLTLGIMVASSNWNDEHYPR